MKRHILVVSQYFYPEQFRINDICQEWIRRGYQVTVITGIPNYPQGKFYQGYGWFKKRKEEYHGINIIRLPLFPRKKNVVMLILNYLSFVISGWFWGIFTKICADIVFIFEVSPMTQALVGIWYAQKRNISCLLYVQDLWPENVEVVTGIHSVILLKPIEKMVDYIYERCKYIFATSPSFVRKIQNRCEDKDKVIYWPQYAEDFYRPMDKEKAKKFITELPDNDSFKIIFTGNIGKAQGLEILPCVAAELKKISICKKINFVIVGDGRNKESLKKQIEEKNITDMFIIIDAQPAERIPFYLACCDMAFISFANNELFAETIPAKLQSYMACGMPIVASAMGEIEKIIEDAQCGICCPIGNVDILTSKIKEIVNDDIDVLHKMGRNSRIYFEQHFLKEKLMNEMDENFLWQMHH